MIPAVLRSVKCSDIHKCIAGYGKATLYGVVDLGRKKFAKVFVMSLWAPGCSRRSYVISKVPAYKQSNCSIIMIFITF